MTDLRFSLRSLARAPGFSLTAILTLALGIGSAAAIFSVADYALFRSADFPPDLVMLGMTTKRSAFTPFLWSAASDAYTDLKETFRDVAFAKGATANVVVGGEPVANFVSEVSANFLAVLGVTPGHGRGFVPGDEPQRNAIVITDQFRRDVFRDGREPLGQTVLVGDVPCTVVGILAPRQVMPVFGGALIYRAVPLRPDPAQGLGNWPFAFARLQAGVTPDQATAAMATLKLPPPPNLKGFLGDVRPRAANMRDAQAILRRDVSWVLLGAVAFLYAIACLNTTNLMLVRLLGRRRELSIRLALGGSRVRLIGLLVWDALAVSGLGGAFGLLVANWLVPILRALDEPHQHFDWNRWTLDWRAVAVLVTLTVITAVVVVLVPAWRIARADPHAGLKEGGASLGETRGLARMRGSFVALQAAFAVILLTGAGLMVRSFAKIDAVPLGFESHDRVKLKLSFPPGYVAGNEERHAYLKRLQEALTHTPGVRSAAYGTDTLLRGYRGGGVKITVPHGDPVDGRCDTISANFFATTGVTLKRGAMIKESDWHVLINESLARKLFGDADPVGKTLHKTDSGSGDADWLIGGVVSDVRFSSREDPGYEIYTPETWWSPGIDTFVLHTAREPDATLLSSIKRAVYRFDSKIVISQIVGLDEIRGWDRGLESYVGTVLKVLSGFALLLATIGMFSVLAYTVDRRMGEFGVRLALGATAGDLVSLVVARGVMLAVVGVAGGVAGALALVRSIRSMLYQTAPYDPIVLIVVSGVLLTAALLACILPARRASKVDVARLLRAQ